MKAAQPVVTISAAYGTGGRFVAPRIAEILGVRFLDQCVPEIVAEEIAEETGNILAVENDLVGGLRHWVSFFAPVGTAWMGLPNTETGWSKDDLSYKKYLEAVFKREARLGAVIFGRGAAIALRDYPGAIHVRLDGPVEHRIAQAMDVGGLDERSARHAQHQTDAARYRYVHRVFHRDVTDHRIYHMVIDATAVPLATCVDIIVTTIRGCEELRQLGDAGFSEAM